MRDQIFRVLLISDSPDDIVLMEEAFDEFEAIRYLKHWPQPFQLVLASDVDEGVALLGNDRFDAVILDLDLTGVEPLPAYLKLRSSAPQLPVITLTLEEDEPLAMTLIRHGADSYVIKSELDCVPLARTLRRAGERNRLRVARESLSVIDDLTGLFNERGYEIMMQRFSSLAVRHGLSLLTLTIDSGTPEAQDRDAALLQLAEQLRPLFEGSGMLARIGRGRLAALAVVPSIAEATALTKALAGALPPEARLTPELQAGLCENKAV